MIGKKINQLATELAPVSTDLTIIGDPISGVSKKITLAQLGAIFSGAVSFYTNLAGFPATGDINVIYCAKDTQKLYLWSGSAYVEVFPSQALLDTYQLRSEKGVSNGYASLDSTGKVPISQLPSSIMEYKGTWNASTNTPTLANGTGDTGDVYICNVAGTVNFGAGPITFAVGDYVIYSGSIWQRSSGAVGTVTSVAASITGNAIGITGSPVTTSGTLALAFTGTSSQYINGAGNLINFPTSLVTGTGTLYALTKWGFTSGNIINSNLSDTGTTIYNNNPTSGSFAVQFNGNTTTGLSYGLLINAGTNASDIALRVQNASSTSEYFFVYGDGKVQINNIPNATIDTDRFIVSDSGVIKYRTGAELLSDIGGASASGYVPYTGATTNVDLGTHTLSAYNLIINHTSGSGVAASITKGGSGEALTVVKSSGSGNAASITGGVTLLSELHLTTDLADAYIASASNWNDAYNLRHNAVTIGTANGLSLSTQVLSLALASGSTTGALSSTDWTTFNNKQNALTNPVTGTGTTNYLPKFTGTSTLGNSQIFDNGTNVGIGTATPNTPLSIVGSHVSGQSILKIQSATAYSASGLSSIGFNDSDGSRKAIVYTNSDGLQLETSTATPILFNTNGNTRMRLDASGNLGLGVTPSAWRNLFTALQVGYTGSLYSTTVSTAGEQVNLASNYYQDSAGNELRIQAGFATRYQQASGEHRWSTAGSSTAGSGISFTQAMTLDASGRLGIGTTSPSGKLDVLSTYASDTTSQTIFRDNTGVALNFGGTASGSKFIQAQDSTGASTFYNLLLNPRGGNVGIGTTSPVYVDLTGTSGTLLQVTNSSNSHGQIRVGGSNGTVGLALDYSNSGYTSTIIRSLYGAYSGDAAMYLDSGFIAFRTGTSFSERMRITSGGNVGIGTTSPSGKFEIASTANTYASAPAITFTDTSGDASSNRWIVGNIATTYGTFNIASAPTPSSTTYTPRLSILSNGNVGIGTTSPGEKLEVNGNIKTAAPSGGSAGSWKLGTFTSGSATIGGKVRVEINGVAYDLLTT